jgi:hypothetical protein
MLVRLRSRHARLAPMEGRWEKVLVFAPDPEAPESGWYSATIEADWATELVAACPQDFIVLEDIPQDTPESSQTSPAGEESVADVPSLEEPGPPAESPAEAAQEESLRRPFGRRRS